MQLDYNVALPPSAERLTDGVVHAWERGSHRHVLYRRLGHATIFLMIAGTYNGD